MLSVNYTSEREPLSHHRAQFQNFQSLMSRSNGQQNIYSMKNKRTISKLPQNLLETSTRSYLFQGHAKCTQMVTLSTGFVCFEGWVSYQFSKICISPLTSGVAPFKLSQIYLVVVLWQIGVGWKNGCERIRGALGRLDYQSFGHNDLETRMIKIDFKLMTIVLKIQGCKS